MTYQSLIAIVGLPGGLEPRAEQLKELVRAYIAHSLKCEY